VGPARRAPCVRDLDAATAVADSVRAAPPA
jgi:hypothetical protein